MAGGEKKGMFGKLFGRKEKTEDTKPETRKAQTRRPPTKSGKENTQQAANSRVTKDSSPKESKKDSAPKESKKSDAVELELDIPEHEISTVALSVEDLDVSLAPEDHPVATSSPSEEQPVSPQVSPDRDESKAADTTIKLDSAPPTAAEEHVPAPEKSAPGIPTDQEPSRSSEHRPAASQDVPTGRRSILP